MRAQSELEIRILDMIEPVAKARGLDVVRVRVMGRGVPVLQIMAEKPDGTMDVEDCAKFSRALNPLLDEQDPIAGEYSLEVSSPGIDRPLTRLQDFSVWEGCEARLELDRMVENRKRFKGLLAGVDGDMVGVDLEGESEETAWLPFAWIAEAKLVLNDDLMKRGAAQRAARLERLSTPSEEDEA